MQRQNQTTIYVAIWLTVALLMGLLLGFAEFQRNPLNDPDQAWQRSGLLLPAQTYQAPSQIRGGERPRVVVFARNLSHQHLFHDLADQSDLANIADLVIVTPDGSRPVIENGISHFVTDSDGALVKAVGLNKPIDDGYPVGYALIDSEGYIRFRTLDPGFTKRAWEIQLLLKHIT